MRPELRCGNEGETSMHSSRPRRRIRRAVTALAVVAIGAVGLVTTVGGVSSAQSGGKADPNGILKFATDLQVTGVDKGLDPLKSSSVGASVQINRIYDTLLHAQDDGTHKPGVARSYKVEGDN